MTKNFTNQPYKVNFTTKNNLNISIPKFSISARLPIGSDDVLLGFLDSTFLFSSFLVLITYIILCCVQPEKIIPTSAIALIGYVLGFFRFFFVGGYIFNSICLWVLNIINKTKLNFIIIIILTLISKNKYIVISYLIVLILGFGIRICFLDHFYTIKFSNKHMCNLGFADIVLIRFLYKFSRKKFYFYDFVSQIVYEIKNGDTND